MNFTGKSVAKLALHDFLGRDENALISAPFAF